MKTKHLLIFLTAGIALISITIAAFLHKPQEEAVNLLYAEKADEIDLFYYRAVPGLKQAEDLELVRAVNRSFDLPGSSKNLNIDRIWYNKNGVVIFYHVENSETLSYLGGDLYMPGKEPDEKTVYWGSTSIGVKNEKGIVHKGNFYSCLRLPLITDALGKPEDNIEYVLFKPFLSVYDSKNADTAGEPQVYTLKAFDITLNYKADDEPIEKVALDNSIHLEERRLAFYQADLMPSAVRIYFQFLNSGEDRVIWIKGYYETDKGEIQSFEAVPSLLTSYPFHYVFEVPPFHALPRELKLHIESLKIQGKDRIEIKIEPASYGSRPKKHIMEQTVDTLHNTVVILKEVETSRDMAAISIDFITNTPPRDTFTLLDMGVPTPEGYYLPEHLSGQPPLKQANTLVINNNEFKRYDFSRLPLEVAYKPTGSVKIGISRGYWDESKTINIALEELSYLYIVNKETNLFLKP
jgi:hypothetical protein